MHTISKKHLAAITAACTLCCTTYLLGQLSVSALDTSNLVQTGTYNGFTYSTAKVQRLPITLEPAAALPFL